MEGDSLDPPPLPGSPRTQPQTPAPQDPLLLPKMEQLGE